MRYRVTFVNERNGDGGGNEVATVGEAYDLASGYLDRTGHGGMPFALEYFGDIFSPGTECVSFEDYNHNGKVEIRIEVLK